LGYLHQELDQMKQVRSDEKNLPLYILVQISSAVLSAAGKKKAESL
jgi:hypothetical protein